MPTWEEREVKVSAEDKAELMKHIEAIGKITSKYPYFKDPKCHVVTTMCRVKNSAKELHKWIECLMVEDKESEDIA